MNKTTNVSDLNKDIIIAVLSRCDIRTILRVEQTCKDLRDIISSRHLWLALVQNLDHDHAPELLPHETLQSLPVERLRHMAIQSVRGRLNWTSSKGPEITGTRDFELDEGYDSVETQGILVPGGNYFVFQAEDRCIHCYDVEEEIDVFSCQLPPDASEDRVQCMDCFSDDDGTLILAYLAESEWSRAGTRQSVTVVRIDIESEASTIVQSFSSSLGKRNGETNKIKLTNNVVVAAMSDSIFVANWRTGEAAMTERMSLFDDLHIAQGHVLCAIRLELCKIAFVAAPLSLIFAAVKSSATGNKSNFSSPVPVQSQAVFIHFLPLAAPEVTSGKYKPEKLYVVFSSVCTDSWRCPNLCEFDAVGFTTRILLFVSLHVGREQYCYMVYHLEFSPVTKANIDNASRTATSGSADAIDYILTCQRQSPLYLLDVNEPDGGDVLWHGTSRTGRVVGLIRYYGGEPEHVCAIDMHDLLEDKPLGTEAESDHVLAFTRIRPKSISDDWFRMHKLHIEKYSGALWYASNGSLYIHYFD